MKPGGSRTNPVCVHFSEIQKSQTQRGNVAWGQQGPKEEGGELVFNRDRVSIWENKIVPKVGAGLVIEV